MVSMKTRPTLIAAAAEAAQEISKRVIEWLEEAGEQVTSDGSEAEIEGHVKQVIEKNIHNLDGYELAKEMEDRFYYEPDSDLVEIMDNAHCAVLDAHDRIVEKWIVENSIKPRFAIGARVSFKRNQGDKLLYNGEIVHINEKQGKYTVFCEDLGHVRSGCGTHGVVLPFEAVEQESQVAQEGL
jgi:hypothetical protein